MPPAHVVLGLDALLAPRRALFARRLTFSFATLEGDRLVIDTTARRMAEPGWFDDADVTVLTNAKTLSDLISGRFDPKAPGEDHVFMWTGSDDAWAALMKAVRPTRSAFATQVAALQR